jgi:ketosteroid isomerase-like protein
MTHCSTACTAIRGALTIFLFGFVLAGTVAASPAHDAGTAVVKTLNDSAAAFERGDLPAASKVWSHSGQLTVFEGGHVNHGWADYRDNHLAPEMKELRGVRYRLSEVVPHVVGSTAWATFAYSIRGADAGGRTFAGTGIGTAILERERGAWRILHWHTTSTPKPRLPSPGPSPP